MKWLIYCRISTDDQQKWMSLDYQKDRALSFCKENWIDVKEEHIFQETYSWAFFDRPQLSRIFDLVQNDKFDCIIVLRRDRLARDVWVFNQIKTIFDTIWVKVYYPEEALTWEEMIDDFMGNTLVWFAQYEKALIKTRTYTWKRKKSENWILVTHVPYWYIKNEDWKLEVYEPEIKIVKKVVELYLKEKYPIWKIVGYLNDKKISPPALSDKKSPNQRGSQKLRKNSIWFWAYSSVYRILENVSKYYLWEYEAFKTIYKKTWKSSSKIWERDESQIIKIPTPRIFTESIAKQIEERKRINRNHADKKSFRTYLLKGKLFCDCQPDLRNFKWYYNNKKDLRNYRCTMSDKRKASEDRRCNNSISGLKISTLVIDTLRDFFLDFNKFLAEYWLDKTQDSKSNIIDEYKWEIQKLEEKEKRALDLALDWLIDKLKLKEIQDEVKVGIEKFKDVIHEEYELVYNEYKEWLLTKDVKAYTKELHNYALVMKS